MEKSKLIDKYDLNANIFSAIFKTSLQDGQQIES